ncbi:hypothetical protein [Neobacillus sp. PS3-40]|uniref:hypothetical protein n=1 Tax=Neobacillus sp. PS3-40 TaxID=3070679 RepID=UPI0027E14EF7|nr:hypothetical protein [Neobacillus sp. PS3-40]WML44704.1 hypothetical protein RCG20_01985 [Neobacillus sp. PS3-40]
MLKIYESAESLNKWLELDLFSDETKVRIKGADIILVPDIGKIEGITKAFKPDTKTFYKFALGNNPSNAKIEILENEGELTVLNFHSYELWLPNLYIKDVNLLPTVMDLVNQYVFEKQKRMDDIVVNFNLKIQKKDGTCNELAFKGGIDDLNVSIENLDCNAL